MRRKKGVKGSESSSVGVPNACCGFRGNRRKKKITTEEEPRSEERRAFPGSD